MERVLVINGCSHSAGSEIPGRWIGDGRECRDNSFGALLAKRLDRKPIHLAIPGGSNDWISRTSMSWVGDNFEKIKNNELDVLFLVHWTGAERWEYRFSESAFETPFVDHDHDTFYRNLTIGHNQVDSLNDFSKSVYKTFTKMFASSQDFWSDNKMRNVISLQSFLQVMKIPYWFGNAFDSFVQTKTSASMTKLIDRTYFPYADNIEKSYYWFCREAGFENQDEKNILWHLGGKAHEYYANFLKEELDKLNLK